MQGGKSLIDKPYTPDQIHETLKAFG
jgi:hypothetical protein